MLHLADMSPKSAVQTATFHVAVLQGYWPTTEYSYSLQRNPKLPLVSVSVRELRYPVSAVDAYVPCNTAPTGREGKLLPSPWPTAAASGLGRKGTMPPFGPFDHQTVGRF
jgi:hypothetical protein